MTDYLKSNFNELRESEFGKLLDSLERCFNKFEIDYYMVGATARDLWISHLDLPSIRATIDVDFSVYVRSPEQFTELKNCLILKEGFVADKEPYRLYSAIGQIVDLIPFGAIEENGKVVLDEHGQMELSVVGTRC
ncbi:MAG: hypothetical protein WBJ10_17090 [Daejeonella sp.]|uniref:hypothetical protein n=1 Tax=Daejeonella sp. TaxID=2805397 RepID=UPI003C7902F0